MEGNNSCSELIFTLLVFRHGDRTPVSFDPLPGHDEKLQEIIDKYGPGQLTPRGQYRGYQIGQFIRRRYSSLLSPRYNSSEVYIRSTDVTRTKMTSLTCMAAVFSATEDNWSSELKWTPVPYTTEDVMEDFMLAFLNCPKFLINFVNTKLELPEYRNVLEKWSNITGLDFINRPFLIYQTYDYYTCYKSLGWPLDDDLEKLWPDIQKIASVVMDTYFTSKENLPFLVGVLLSQFFTSVDNMIQGYPTQKMRVYSAHDVNVLALTSALMIKEESRPGVPGFGATISLEVKKLKTGHYVVGVLYLSDPDSDDSKYLPIEGCDYPFCDLEYFRNVTSQFILTEREFKEACQADMDIPLSYFLNGLD